VLLVNEQALDKHLHGAETSLIPVLDAPKRRKLLAERKYQVPTWIRTLIFLVSVLVFLYVRFAYLTAMRTTHYHKHIMDCTVPSLYACTQQVRCFWMHLVPPLLVRVLSQDCG